MVDIPYDFNSRHYSEFHGVGQLSLHITDKYDVIRVIDSPIYHVLLGSNTFQSVLPIPLSWSLFLCGRRLLDGVG